MSTYPSPRNAWVAMLLLLFIAMAPDLFTASAALAAALYTIGS